MTFEKFKMDIRELLESSNVNLGRKKAKTRQDLVLSIIGLIDDFGSMTTETGHRLCDCHFKPQGIDVNEEIENEKEDNGRLLCLKPKDKRAALNVGKGVHAMTPDQSQVADEQLDRSPYVKKRGKNEQDKK